MVILGSIITGVLIVSGLTNGIDEGLPSWAETKELWPMEILYCLPRIVAPFFLLYSMVFCEPQWTQLLICAMLYLFSLTVKAVYWRFIYGINIFSPKSY